VRHKRKSAHFGARKFALYPHFKLPPQNRTRPEEEKMADDLDVEALLEAPFRKDGDEVSCERYLVSNLTLLHERKHR